MPERQFDKTKMWICICILLSNSAYALIAPFLPIEFEIKGITGGFVGVIFMSFSAAVIILSPFVCNFIKLVGKRNLIAFGIFTMGVCFVFFGYIDNMKNIW